jgi:hypothetical protein
VALGMSGAGVGVLRSSTARVASCSMGELVGGACPAQPARQAARVTQAIRMRKNFTSLFYPKSLGWNKNRVVCHAYRDKQPQRTFYLVRIIFLRI